MIRKLGFRIPKVHPTAYVDPDATVIGWVEIGAYCFIGPGARIRGDNALIQIGDYTNVQDNAIIHVSPGSPTLIGQHVTISHNTIIHGCTIEDRVLVGMNCVVENGAVIHADTILDVGVHIPSKWVVAEPSLVRNHTAKSWAEFQAKAVATPKVAKDETHRISERDFRIFTPRAHQLKLILDNAQQYVDHCVSYRAEQEEVARYMAGAHPMEAFQKEALQDIDPAVNAAVASLRLVHAQMM